MNNAEVLEDIESLCNFNDECLDDIFVCEKTVVELQVLDSVYSLALVKLSLDVR